MRRKKKIYKKVLSCVLAAAMVVTSGTVYPGNVRTVLAAEKDPFQDLNNNTWNVVKDEDGVIQDTQGVLYRLESSGTATVVGFEYSSSGSVTIPDTVPVSYTDYQSYKNGGTMPGTSTSSNVTAIADNAFSGNADLTEVIVSGNVTSIGDAAFASCPNLTEVNWMLAVTEGSVEIGGKPADESNAEIFSDSPKCVLKTDNTLVTVYAKNKEYTSPRADNTDPTASSSADPTVSPSADPTASPSTDPTASSSADPTASSSADPTATPSVAPAVTPGTVPTASPGNAPTSVPSATPTASSNPSTPTPTPRVPVRPSLPVIPSMAPATQPPVVATMAPAEQTPVPGETTAPTSAPTAPASTPVPPSEKPAITEAPNPVESQTPSDNTPTAKPVQPAPPKQEIVVKNHVTYEVDMTSGSVSVSDMSKAVNNSTTVKIPAEVEVDGKKYPVTEIDAGAFKNNKKIVKVQLGENIEKIKAGAFRGCQNLVKVEFPSGLEVIGKNSFEGSGLKSVKVPGTVQKIRKGAFMNCSSLESFSVGDNPKQKKGGLSFDGKEVRYGASTVTINIGNQAFENCKKLNKVIINALVKIIGKSAFKDCKSLRSVLIYSKVLKQVKGGALTGVKNCTISVPAKKVKPYKILFKNKGQGKKVVVAKF